MPQTRVETDFASVYRLGLRQGGAASRAVFVIRTLCLTAALAACGCAHHKANQYTYAPPLAPPVYPQPQTVGQPVAYPPGAVPVAAPPAYAPPGGVPMAPAGMPMAPAGMPVMPTGAEIPALPDGSCPPCQTAGGAVPVAYEGVVQTTPCPPGP